MTQTTLYLCLALVLTPILLIAEPTAHARPSTTAEASPLCPLLETLLPGDSRVVVVQGVFVVGPESAFLYDPSPGCPESVQPATWVEISSSLDGSPGEIELSRRVDAEGRALVTFAGVLEGPGVPGPDDPSLPEMISYSRRTGERYGHLNAFRSRLRVDGIKEIRPVPDDSPPPDLSPPRSDRHLLQAGRMPLYPEMARRAGISGRVQLQIETEGGEVTSARVLSGDRLLAHEARRVAETWSFDGGSDASFVVSFDFRLVSPQRSCSSTTIELDLPARVRISAPAYGW